jgi:hypothetical protein
MQVKNYENERISSQRHINEILILYKDRNTSIFV